MGLSASQTRFLSLTARKSNVEFQGQQVNQARTALANQSSELFTEMMNLKAPIAPSVYQYVINPATNPTIDWSDPNAYPLNKNDAKNFMIYYAGNQPSFQDFNIPEYVERTVTNADGTTTTGWCKKSTDDKGNTVYGTPIANQDDIPGTYCCKETGKDVAGNDVEFYNVHVSENENFTYDVKTGTFTPKVDVKDYELPKWIQAFNLAASQYSTFSKPTKTAIYSKDTDLTTVTDNISTNDPTPIGYKSTSSVNINQAQYNQAMVQYEADLKEYEEALEVINQKTEEIHEADKKLEMQLKQLDTEQEAIQTEYEAVKKVIDKNIENTFKSFA